MIFLDFLKKLISDADDVNCVTMIRLTIKLVYPNTSNLDQSSFPFLSVGIEELLIVGGMGTSRSHSMCQPGDTVSYCHGNYLLIDIF